MQENDIIKYTTQVSIVAIFANVILAVVKFIAGLIGNSSALISDAVHSLSDVLSSFIVIAGVRIGNKKSDFDHPYGHERLESIAAIILAGLLLTTGIGIGFVGIEKIYTGEYENMPIPTNIALYVAIFSIFAKEAMYWYTYFAAKKIKSDILMADAWHHRSDSLSSVGSLIGVLGSQFGYVILDPLASVIICFFIVQSSYEIFKSAVDKLTDKSADNEISEKIKIKILENDKVIRLDILKTRMFGNKLYVDIEISVNSTLSLIEAHNIAEDVHENLEKSFPEIKHCMVHVNPSYI